MKATIGTGLLQTVDHSNPLQQLSDAGQAIGDVIVTSLPAGVALGAVCISAAVATTPARYKRRRKTERRRTGKETSLREHLPQLLTEVKPGQKLTEINPAMPHVATKIVGRKELFRFLRRTDGTWTLPGFCETEPHVTIIARSGAMKNQTLFDPCVVNAIFCRPEPVIINDVKAALFDKLTDCIPNPQYVYTFDGRHDRSAAINLVQTREIAEHTAVALYPIGGQKVKIYNRMARALFLALVEEIGYPNASLKAVRELASDRDRLTELTQSNPKINGILGGDNRTLVGDIISSLNAPLEPLDSELVSRVFGHTSDQPSLQANEVVWIVIPEGAEDTLGPLAGAIMRNMYERAKLAPNVVRFCVDEAGSCLAFDDLENFLSVGRGQGVYCMLSLQNRAQLDAKIGSDNTNSALGSAGTHYWGPNNDPSTTHYISDLSGTTEGIELATYTERGLTLAWHQLVRWREAEHEWRPWSNRRVLQTHHANGLPTGCWYRYDSDPMAITLIAPEPMYEWQHEVLRPAKTRYAGLSRELPAPVEPPEAEPPRPKPQAKPQPQGTIELHPLIYEPPQDDGRNGHARHPSRACEACDYVTEDQDAKYCAGCGGRLPA